MSEQDKWTVPELIGTRIKERREHLHMTARELGDKMGAAVAKSGKSWPPQTVYMMEAGERSMIAAEVVAAAHILQVPVLALFAPPIKSEDHVDSVMVGPLAIPPETLAGTSANESERLMNAAEALRAVEEVRGEIFELTQEQFVLLSDAKRALQGLPKSDLPEGDKPHEAAARQVMDAARERYPTEGPSLEDMRTYLLRGQGPEDEDDGE